MPIHIRPFAPTDQSAAKQLILQGMQDRWGWIDYTANPDLDDIWATYCEQGHPFFVVVEAGVLVGTGALLIEGDGFGRIVRMSVHRDWRRQGIAKMMTHHLITTAQQKHCHTLLVETNLTWHSAIQLYLSCGFLEQKRDDTQIHLALSLEKKNLQDFSFL